MRPAAVGFAAGSDVQAIGDGDFIFSEGVDSPRLLINTAVGDTISVVCVPMSGIANATIYNGVVTESAISRFMADGGSEVPCSLEKTGEGVGITFEEISGYLMAGGSVAIAVTINKVFCGRVLAFNSSHTVEDAKSIPLPIFLNGNWTNTSGVEHPRISYVHCEESTAQNPVAWFDFPGSNREQLMKAAHIEIFMFNAEVSMLSITTDGGPVVEVSKRRYGLIVDVVPDGDVPFALSSSKLFGAVPSWWCQLTEI